MNVYIPILILFGFGALIAGAMVVGSWLLGPKRPTPAKQAPYECGVTPVGNARERFPIHFYLVAMLFIIFDVEAIFLYPWFVIFKKADPQLKLFSFLEVVVFLGLIVVGYLFVLFKGALEWERPVLHERRKGAPVERERKEEVLPVQ